MPASEHKKQPVEPHIPGSPEDLQLAFEILQGFFAEKLKAARLYHQTGRIAEGTNNTHSLCHIDGTTDPDSWDILA